MEKNRFIYISLEQAIEVHDHILSNTSGFDGGRDYGQLNSILTHIQNDDYYPKVFDKVAHLIYGIIKFHVFNDGNKRTALALGAYFLGLNYSSALAEKFIIQMENVVVDVASDKINKDLLRDIIKAIFFEDEDNEELLFKIYTALESK